MLGFKHWSHAPRNLSRNKHTCWPGPIFRTENSPVHGRTNNSYGFTLVLGGVSNQGRLQWLPRTLLISSDCCCPLKAGHPISPPFDIRLGTFPRVTEIKPLRTLLFPVLPCSRQCKILWHPVSDTVTVRSSGRPVSSDTWGLFCIRVFSTEFSPLRYAMNCQV